MASGMARGAKARGKRIAFGDLGQIVWDNKSSIIFQGNMNIAPPGSEGASDLEWIPYYKGHRIYNQHDRVNNRWIWNMDFRPVAGEMFFTGVEKRNATRFGTDFVIIEPNVERWKSSSTNKDWGIENYQDVADQLKADGYRVAQFAYPRGVQLLKGVDRLRTLSFRDALAVMSRSLLYIGPEGGLHHGAAAVGKRAVVLFGGFIPPQVTGYPNHTNLTGGATACGSLSPCEHCREALAAISVEEVYSAARKKL